MRTLGLLVGSGLVFCAGLMAGIMYSNPAIVYRHDTAHWLKLADFIGFRAVVLMIGAFGLLFILGSKRPTDVPTAVSFSSELEEVRGLIGPTI